MMRYSLSLDTDLVQVSEELGYIRDYLFLLKLRHEDHLMVEVRQDSAADQLLIAKFILQPLVENAVKYSLEKKGGNRRGGHHLQCVRRAPAPADPG
ncbi:sensor histidine kinase [Paenibacillus rhizoplanae]